MSYFAFTIPASITCLIPEIVTEVSAMFVATITFLHAYKIIIISTYIVSLLGFIVDNLYVILNNSVLCQMHQFKWSCKIVLTSNRVTTLPIKIQSQQYLPVVFSGRLSAAAALEELRTTAMQLTVGLQQVLYLMLKINKPNI